MSSIVRRVTTASVATVVFVAAVAVVADAAGWIPGIVPEVTVGATRWTLDPEGWREVAVVIGAAIAGALVALLLGVVAAQREQGAPWHAIVPRDPADRTALSVTISNHAMRAIVARVALGVEGVHAADPRVTLRRGAWRIDSRLALAPGAVVPAVSRQVSELVRDAVEAQTGVRVGALRLRASIASAQRIRLR